MTRCSIAVLFLGLQTLGGLALRVPRFVFTSVNLMIKFFAESGTIGANRVIMKKIFSFVCVAAAVLSMSSCAVVATPAGIGGLYTDVQSGLTATSNTVGKKVGTSSAINVLGIVATGDASINAAAKNGGITKISHVDQKQTSVLGLFAKSETVVYGE